MKFVFWSDTNERLWQDAVESAGFQVSYSAVQKGSSSRGAFTGTLPDYLVEMARDLSADVID